MVRPLVSSACLGTNSALVHFVAGKRSAGLLSSLVGQPTSILSQLIADLFDTISIKADTAQCNISLAVLQVRREAVLDLLNPEQTVELNLHPDPSGRPHWNFEKLTEIVRSVGSRFFARFWRVDTTLITFIHVFMCNKFVFG